MLSAHLIVFCAGLLQLRCHPYACRMLDTLQAASLAVLAATTIALMAPALNQAMAPGLGADSQQSIAVTAAALAVAGALNLAVLVGLLYTLVLEGRRVLLLVWPAGRQGDIHLGGCLGPAAHGVG